MSRHWMPMYWADFKSDTEHLGALETGAYMMLIGHYWMTGGLPNDDKRLARIARMTQEEWAEARETLAEFFHDGWRHKRIDQEISDAQEAYERRANAGRKGGKATQEAKQCSSNATSNAQAMFKQSQPQPHILSTDVDNKREAAPLELLSECLSVETAKDLIAHRKAKKSPMTAGAAKALVKSFLAYGDPEGAAQTMMARGWTGFKPEWLTEQTRAPPPSNGKGGMASLLAKTMGLKNGQAGGNFDENVYGLPGNERVERGNERGDGRVVSGNIIDLLPANSG